MVDLLDFMCYTKRLTLKILLLVLKQQTTYSLQVYNTLNRVCGRHKCIYLRLYSMSGNIVREQYKDPYRENMRDTKHSTKLYKTQIRQ